MQTTLIPTLIVYLLALLVIGIYFGSKNKNASDYLVGGHNLPTWAITLTLTASLFGGGMMVGAAQNGYDGGTMYLVNLLWTLLGFVLVAVLIKGMKGFSEYHTVTEYLDVRYQSKIVRVSCAALSMIALIGLTAGQVASLTNILTALGLGDPTTIAFACMAVIIILTVVGGFLAVTATDCFQIIIAFLGMAIMCVIVFSAHGGLGNIFATLGGMAESLPQDYLKPITAEKLPYLFWVGMPGMLYLLIGQDLYERLFGCRNLTESRKASVIAGIFTTLLGVPGILFGITARIDFPQLAEEGHSMMALALMIEKYMPGILGAIFVCAILSAILSTGDSCLTAATSHFINDIWCVCIDQKADLKSKRMLTVSRVFTLIAGAGALFISFKVTTLVTIFATCYYIYTSSALAPIVVGVLWKGANKYGAIAGIIAGFVATVMGLRGFTLGPLSIDLFGALSSAVVMVIVSLATKNKVGAATVDA